MKFRCKNYLDFKLKYTWLHQAILSVNEVYRIAPVNKNHEGSDYLKHMKEHCKDAVLVEYSEHYLFTIEVTFH